jgi:thioredoxin reductase/Pyruvate/2-oxoacid:ferredoxin oxidoreductase delta subunit
MLLTTLAFVLLAAILVAAQMRRARRAEGPGTAPPAPCPRCGAAAAGEPACPRCRAPRSAYLVVAAPRVEETAGGGVPAGGARPLHALVRADLCVGCGTCVDACPEPGAITIVDQRARVDLGLCRGHARCRDACPVGAIVLSSGEGVQHVEVPDLSVHFESNVPGLYVVGELGGRGLIKNAINEGKLAIEHAARSLPRRARAGPDSFDVVIAGSGPAGLSAALECHRAGLSAVVLEQGSLSDSIHKYPRRKLLLAEPTRTPLYGDLWVADASKEMLLQVWQQVIERTPLDVRTGHRVERIERHDRGFVVHAGDLVVHGSVVVLALGRRGTPRRLGVPGEERDGVYYDIVEMEAFAGQNVLVVGGGDSAIESALGLSHQPGTTVALAYRGTDFARAKERNRAHLDEAVAAGALRLWLSTEVHSIHEGTVMLETGGRRHEQAADAVIVRIGGDPPAAFLAAAGVRVVKKALPLAGAILALALSAAAVAPVHAQVSPGPLAAAHAKLDGPTQCFQCHAGAGASRSGMDDRCLACHGEIAALKKARRGFHARTTGTCASCHPDHAGRDFALVAWPAGSRERFDHARTGYPLEGAHARAECRDCHRATLQRSPVARSIRKVDRAQSWLGLPTDCASCHADPHRGTLGADCRSCHDLERWEPASAFDHARTEYPLTGKHASVDCASCHRPAALFSGHATRPPAAAVLRFSPEPHGSCADCHRDPHAGRMGPACARCHTTATFTAIRPGGFDHERTRYPLRGAHARVACARCHDAKPGGARPPFDTCGACHADAHAGSATRRGQAADCAACHGVASFRPSTFKVEEHATTAFPLAGRHETVPCTRCHGRGSGAAARARLGSAAVELRPAHGACADCHPDAHGGQLAAREDKGACESCHQVQGFRPSLIGSRDHERFAFRLEGRHAAADCRACHAPAREPFRFALGQPACVACHADPHGGQFAAQQEAGSCGACHDAHAFVPPRGFDHGRTGFRLEGAHAQVACADCHVTVRDEKGRRVPRYAGTPRECAACHAAAPGGSGGS